jgi:hypothetical protein
LILVAQMNFILTHPACRQTLECREQHTTKGTVRTISRPPVSIRCVVVDRVLPVRPRQLIGSSVCVVGKENILAAERDQRISTSFEHEHRAYDRRRRRIKGKCRHRRFETFEIASPE